MSQKLIENLESLKTTETQYINEYDIISNYFKTKPFEGVFPKELIQSMNSKAYEDKEELIKTMKIFMTIGRKYAQYKCSQFDVGGCCYCNESGNAYIGFNMESENQWIQFTVHGEQCTINNAFIHGEKEISLLVISFTPCGFCRQFLNELENRDSLEIFITTLNKLVRLRELLPYDFRPSDLPPIEFPDVNNFKIVEIKNEKKIVEKKNEIDEVIQIAKESKLNNLLCYLGVGIKIKNETKLFKGFYIENCAHNPSLHPVNGAISQLLLNGFTCSEIDYVIVVEYKFSQFKLGSSTKAILNGYGYDGDNFIYITIE